MPSRILPLFVAVAAMALAVQMGNGAAAQPRADELSALAASDPELANHFGLFTTWPVTVGDYGGKLVAAANIVSSLMGKRVSPEALNELASREKLFSENAYGAEVILDGFSLAKLLGLATDGRYAVSLEGRVAGRVPSEEAQEAEASSDLFVILVYLDHVPMIEKSIAWTPEGAMALVRVVNPLAIPGAPVPYKALSQYAPDAFDAWEFYRFRKAKK
jgi:hypothetical protein